MYRYLLTLMLASLVSLAQAAAPRDAATYFFDQSLGDFQEELAIAKEEGKQGVLLFFEMDECPFCHRMKETVLNQPEVQDYYKAHFQIFRVDIEGDVEIVDFQGNTVAEKDFAFEHNRVRATPVFLFVDLNGESIARYTGPTRDTEEFLLLGEYVINGSYRDMSFTRYKREQRNKGGVGYRAPAEITLPN